MPVPADFCPVYAPFFGVMGCAGAMIFSCFGAAYGTAKAGVGICSASVLRPDLMMRNSLPVILAGILAIYGLVISVVIANDIRVEYSLFSSMIHLGAGLAVGLAAMAAGFAIGIVGDAGVRASVMQPRMFMGMVLILIMAEVLGLYGLIVALMINARSAQGNICGGMLGLD